MEASVVDSERIIAIGLLTENDLGRLGPSFRRIYRVEEAPCFADLLRAIDEADRELRQAGDDPSGSRVPR